MEERCLQELTTWIRLKWQCHIHTPLVNLNRPCTLSATHIAQEDIRATIKLLEQVICPGPAGFERAIVTGHNNAVHYIKHKIKSASFMLNAAYRYANAHVKWEIELERLLNPEDAHPQAT